MTINIKRVPEFLRKPVSDLDSLFPFLAAQLNGIEDTDAAYAYYGQAIEHQTTLAKHLDSGAAKGFPAELIKVEEFDRETKDGNLLGTKVRLVFAEMREVDGKRIHESIDTGWVSYEGYISDETAWDLALANSVADTAEDLLSDARDNDRPCHVFVTKLVLPILDRDGKATQKKSRTAIHIERGFAKKVND